MLELEHTAAQKGRGAGRETEMKFYRARAKVRGAMVQLIAKSPHSSFGGDLMSNPCPEGWTMHMNGTISCIVEPDNVPTAMDALWDRREEFDGLCMRAYAKVDAQWKDEAR